MAERTIPSVVAAGEPELSVEKKSPSALRNFLRYAIVRVSIIAGTVVIAVFVTIIIANLGGHVDEIIRGQIAESIIGMAQAGAFDDIPEEERVAAAEEIAAGMEEAAGLNDPFLLRTARWLWDGLTLDWAIDYEQFSRRDYVQSSADTRVGTIIANNLARSLLIFGSANLVLFLVTISLALILTRNVGGFADKLFAYLTPLSAAPAWVYGVLLTVFLLRFFGFSTGGTFDEIPTDAGIAFLPVLLRHLFPPFLAIVLSGIFQGVYAWRTLFLIHANEDYVDLARAKGLSPRLIERRYILRPALPAVLTSFALLAMGLFQELIALEYFFNVQGIGRVLLIAIRTFDTPVIVGTVVTFAYLLAITVFVLDIIYALVDPRVRIAGGSQKSGSVVAPGRPWWRFWERWSIFSGRKKKQTLVETRPETAPPTPSVKRTPVQVVAEMGQTIARWIRSTGAILRQLASYRSAVWGLIIILSLIAISIYTVVTIPYEEASASWHNEGSALTRNPRAAPPAWINLFRLNDLPETMSWDSHDGEVSKTGEVISENITQQVLTYSIPYDYGGFPQELSLYFDASFDEKAPHVVIYWLTPDGRDIELTSFSPQTSEVYHFTLDERLHRRLDSPAVNKALFLDPSAERERVLRGEYQLRIEALHFEEEGNVDAEFVMVGQVHGLAGTDQKRRDLMTPLLWGTPVALAFGIVAAGVTSVSSMLLAAFGAWYGGWVDRIIQFLTEVNLILPFLPVALMIFTLYSRSILVVLAVVVLLSIFGNSIKTYRAIFLQVKEEPYLEAAQTYGASNMRIVVRYLLPRIMAVLVPRLMILVPSYVFLEATLAFLGVTDLELPTWGKLLSNALGSSIYTNAYHLVLIPLGLLLLIGFAFALVGLALENIFQPRLRES